MHGLFETEFGVRMICAEEKICAVAASSDGAALLGVVEGALLLVERLAFTRHDKQAEFRRSRYSTLAHHFRNELDYEI